MGVARDKDGPTSVRLIVVDVSSGQKFVWPGSGVPSKADIHSFVTSVVAGAATGVGLKAAV